MAEVGGQAGTNTTEITVELLTATSDYWVDVLHTADIAATRLISIEELWESYSCAADGQVGSDKGSYAFSVYDNHPSGHHMTQIDHYLILPTEASVVALTPAERFENPPRVVLADVGYSEEKVDTMQSKLIAETA